GRKWSRCLVFRGNAPATIDGKGRLKVPNSFRSQLESKYGRELFLTSLTGEYVRIYPLPVWLEIEQKLAEMPSTHPSKLRFLDRVHYFGQTGRPDAGATRRIGLDRDADALAIARTTLAPWSDRVDLVHADYRALEEVLDARGISLVDGTLADLGVSSLQLDAAGRGFSFQRDEPLDMRMDRSRGDTAAGLVRRARETEIAAA